MIDKTECVMFYNTPNSISMADDLRKLKKEKRKVTLSPWIYHELAITSLIRKEKLKRKIPLLENTIIHNAYGERNSVNIEHDIEKYLNNMISISDEELKKWKKQYAILTHKVDGDGIPYVQGFENIHPLDVLYNLPII